MFAKSIRREIDASLGRELHEWQRPDDGGVEQEHTRIAVLSDDPRMHTARVHAAIACDAVGEPERLERGAGAHHRHRPVVPPAGEVLGHHVDAGS